MLCFISFAPSSPTSVGIKGDYERPRFYRVLAQFTPMESGWKCHLLPMEQGWKGGVRTLPLSLKVRRVKGGIRSRFQGNDSI